MDLRAYPELAQGGTEDKGVLVAVCLICAANKQKRLGRPDSSARVEVEIKGPYVKEELEKPTTKRGVLDLVEEHKKRSAQSATDEQQSQTGLRQQEIKVDGQLAETETLVKQITETDALGNAEQSESVDDYYRLTHMLEHDPESERELREMLKRAAESLAKLKTLRGTWESKNSFVHYAQGAVLVSVCALFAYNYKMSQDIKDTMIDAQLLLSGGANEGIQQYAAFTKIYDIDTAFAFYRAMKLHVDPVVALGERLKALTPEILLIIRQLHALDRDHHGDRDDSLTRALASAKPGVPSRGFAPLASLDGDPSLQVSTSERVV